MLGLGVWIHLPPTPARSMTVTSHQETKVSDFATLTTRRNEDIGKMGLVKTPDVKWPLSHEGCVNGIISSHADRQLTNVRWKAANGWLLPAGGALCITGDGTSLAMLVR